MRARNRHLPTIAAFVAALAAAATAVSATSALAQGNGFSGAEAQTYYRVAGTRPPDAYLALRTQPSGTTGQRLDTMPNGTLLRVLQMRNDGWWQVQEVVSGMQGWALSGQAGRTWISCCTAAVALPAIPTKVLLTPAAQKKLADNGEGIHFAVVFFGTPGSFDPTLLPGDVTLASQDIDIKPGQTATLGGMRVSAVDLQSLEPMIWMNVYSSRFVFTNNLLDCDSIQEPWRDLTKAGALTIRCKLIGEPG